MVLTAVFESVPALARARYIATMVPSAPASAVTPVTEHPGTAADAGVAATMMLAGRPRPGAHRRGNVSTWDSPFLRRTWMARPAAERSPRLVWPWTRTLAGSDRTSLYWRDGWLPGKSGAIARQIKWQRSGSWRRWAPDLRPSLRVPVAWAACWLSSWSPQASGPRRAAQARYPGAAADRRRHETRTILTTPRSVAVGALRSPGGSGGRQHDTLESSSRVGSAPPLRAHPGRLLKGL
jgi:hypothetical protein